MRTITLSGQWIIRAPLAAVFKVVTDFENYPSTFPLVADSIRVISRMGNKLELEATVKSFGRRFIVNMKIEILQGRGFISDNDSYQFGTSGHEELLLVEHSQGTLINYTYDLTIHKQWLRLVAVPLLRWYSMRYWERAVIERLREVLEKA